jgi:Fe-Mn family superoxide dismutase
MKRIQQISNILKFAKEKEKKISLEKLTFKNGDLEPIMSEATIKYHYGKLAAGYVSRYNDGLGDPDFNEAGAYLHNIFFPQLMPPKSGNKPFGKIKDLIDQNFESFESFKEEMKKEAMKIQGSGWIYLSKNGEIRTIKNHQIKKDILLLIDWWEHAWALDYQSDKEKYINNLWKIINWDLINNRIL